MNHLDKIKTRTEIREISKQLKQQGKKLVTLNGSFDLLHSGHLKILKEAKDQGDILIIGLNSDSSIKQYKSKDKPLIQQEFRADLLSSIQYVDYLTIFDETTPFEFIKSVKPDIHVNGSEYGKNCIEAELVKELGGKLHIVQLKPNISTSDIIKKIKHTS